MSAQPSIRIIYLWVFLAFLTSAPYLLSDQIIMKDGRVRQGTILSQNEDIVRLQISLSSGNAEIRILRKDIKQIKKGDGKRDAALKSFDKQLKTAQGDTKKLHALADVDPADAPLFPLKAKGAAEGIFAALWGAIPLAVHNATGVWMRDMTCRPEKILKELGKAAFPATKGVI